VSPRLDVRAELEAEFKRGNIAEADLRDPAFHLDGFCDHGTKRVYVNPRPAVIETLIHELTHRRWPAWSERRVLRESRRVLAKMSDAEVADWYRKYQRAVKRHRRPKRITEDE
jgi:hypothetical protein